MLGADQSCVLGVLSTWNLRAKGITGKAFFCSESRGSAGERGNEEGTGQRWWWWRRRSENRWALEPCVRGLEVPPTLFNACLYKYRVLSLLSPNTPLRSLCEDHSFPVSPHCPSRLFLFYSHAIDTYVILFKISEPQMRESI